MRIMTVSPTFAHIVLQRNQLEHMRDFYLALLGAHVVYEGNSMVFITFDEEHHRIAFFGPPGGGLPERSPATVGLAHSAFTFPSLHDLMDKYTELGAMGIEPRVAVQHGVTTSLYYRDPDGNAVEMQVDNFKTADEATVYMLGPEYGNDPVGPSFDVAALATALQDGDP
jgi:catechol-2,3-dioxygenase